jgi:hypothetical protein
MSDIVERLRNWRTVHLTQLRYVMESAADEIERLRLSEKGDFPKPENAANGDNVLTAAERSIPSRGSHGSPAAWGVMRVGGRWVSILGSEEQAETSRKSFDAMENWVHVVRPLYEKPQPTLTDEEREAIEVAAQAYADDHGERFAATLRKLLERLK